jgi:hypothetical protein
VMCRLSEQHGREPAGVIAAQEEGCHISSWVSYVPLVSIVIWIYVTRVDVLKSDPAQREYCTVSVYFLCTVKDVKLRVSGCREKKSLKNGRKEDSACPFFSFMRKGQSWRVGRVALL